jgi:uncharacterized membrane protein
MKIINAEIEINAPCDRVWSILSDFGSYPSWNPFIREIHGRPEVGSTLTVAITPPSGKTMRFKPRIYRSNRHAN